MQSLAYLKMNTIFHALCCVMGKKNKLRDIASEKLPILNCIVNIFLIEYLHIFIKYQKS